MTTLIVCVFIDESGDFGEYHGCVQSYPYGIKTFELYDDRRSGFTEERDHMNEVNKTLYIPLYGKSKVSQQGIILNDPSAERIWKEEAFPIRGKSRSKWLAYNMAMRARVFDDWTDSMLQRSSDALVLHIGCGLDSRHMRVKTSCSEWVDCDLPDVIERGYLTP